MPGRGGRAIPGASRSGPCRSRRPGRDIVRPRAPPGPPPAPCHTEPAPCPSEPARVVPNRSEESRPRWGLGRGAGTLAAKPRPVVPQGTGRAGTARTRQRRRATGSAARHAAGVRLPGWGLGQGFPERREASWQRGAPGIGPVPFVAEVLRLRAQGDMGRPRKDMGRRIRSYPLPEPARPSSPQPARNEARCRRAARQRSPARPPAADPACLGRGEATAASSAS